MSGKTIQENSSEIRRGKETTVIWNLKGKAWTDGRDEKKDEDSALLRLHSNCVVNLDEGENGLGPRACLHFYLGVTSSHRGEQRRELRGNGNEPEYLSYNIETTWLALYVEKIHADKSILQYDFEVGIVNEQLQAIGGIYFKTRKGFLQYCGPHAPFIPRIDLKPEFMKMRETVKCATGGNVIPKTEVFPPMENLRLKISVTPIYLHTETAHPKGEGAASLCQALKGMFASEENYSDLKLETKDKMTLSAHKFILAARSSVLRTRIEKAVKENNFSGTIQLSEVNAKPMMVLLHWMYTEELHTNTEKFMEEVLDAAIKFQLTVLLRMLDKKVIGICTQENMYQLIQTVQKYGMVTAVADIKQFIKENI